MMITVLSEYISDKEKDEYLFGKGLILLLIAVAVFHISAAIKSSLYNLRYARSSVFG